MRRTIGQNPLDAVVPLSTPLPDPVADIPTATSSQAGESIEETPRAARGGANTSESRQSGSGQQSETRVKASAKPATPRKSVQAPINTPESEEEPSGPKKERLTLHISTPLINRAKNAVYWTPGLTLADLGERALEIVVSEIEKENGGPFKPRPHELKGGRPMK